MLSGVDVRNNHGTGILVGPDVSHYTVTGCKISANGIGAVLDGCALTHTQCQTRHHERAECVCVHLILY
jgi:hypothetical protein